MGKTIQDEILISTINKMFKGEVVDVHLGGPDTRKGVGVPQGNPVSAILANIYLNELDNYILKLKDETDQGQASNRKANPEWTKATWVAANELKVAKSHKAKRMLRRDLYRKKVKEAEKLKIKRHLTSEIEHAHEYCRLHYVRYADDYLIAIKGPKELALKVKDRCEEFIKSDLHLEVKGENNLLH